MHRYADDLIRRSDDLRPLLPVLFGLIGYLAGVVAIVSAIYYVRLHNSKSRTVFACIVSAFGGVWSANAWFNWPFAPDGTFSLLRALGTVIAFFCGFGLC